MQQHIHTIVKHFFQKDSLQEVPEQALQQFTEEHPYSSVGHWLLAKKLRQSSDERYEAQSTRTSTWFTNPLWLEWTLEDHKKTPETLIIPALSKEQPVVTTQAPEIIIAEPEAAPVHIAAPEQEPEAVQEPETPLIAEEEAPVEKEKGASVTTEPEEELETEIFIPGVAEPISLVEEPVSQAEAQPAPEPEEPEVVEEVAVIEIQTPATEKPVEKIPASPVNVLRLDEFKPSISEAEEPVFEPYHTIDYFASLGIKLKQEDLKDKLGMQLKSFTEWLRSMKRIAPTAMEVNANAFDETMQQSIQEIAGHSVEGKEVLTEAMADVWAKQGNRQKAIAIYEKLSLLNPVKSAYFAAQIEKLKAS